MTRGSWLKIIIIIIIIIITVIIREEWDGRGM